MVFVGNSIVMLRGPRKSVTTEGMSESTAPTATFTAMSPRERPRSMRSERAVRRGDVSVAQNVEHHDLNEGCR